MMNDELSMTNDQSTPQPNSRPVMPLPNFPLWAGLTFWAASLLAFSGMAESAGELRILAAAGRLAAYGIPADSTLAWVFAPLMWLGQRLPGLNPLHLGLLTNSLLPAIVTGLLAWAAMRRGMSPRAVLWLTLVFGALGIARKFNGDSPPMPVWLASADDLLPVRLYLFLPPAILGAVVAGNLWWGWRGEKTIPLWLVGVLTVWLTGQFLLGAAHFSARTDVPADTAVRAALASAAPDDTVWVSLPPDDDPPAFETWWVGNVRTPAPMTIVPADASVNDAPLPVRGIIRLYERRRRASDPPHPAAVRLAAQEFPLAETWLNGGGRLSRYAAFPANLLAVPVNVSFDGGIALETFAITAQIVSPGDVLGVRLRWQSAGTPDAPVVGFVHLIGVDGALAAQQDRLLQNTGVPQGYGLQLPADAPPGDYPLVVGLYRQDDGARLARADGSPDDFLYLITIVVP